MYTPAVCKYVPEPKKSTIESTLILKKVNTFEIYMSGGGDPPRIDPIKKEEQVNSN